MESGLIRYLALISILGLLSQEIFGAGSGIADLFRGKGVPVQVFKGALSTRSKQFRNVAVVDFGGTDGRSFATNLRSELQSAEVQGSNVFEVSNVATLIQGRFDLKNLVAAGRRSGLDAIYYGEANHQIQKSNSRIEKRCGDRKGLFGKCKQYINVRCQNIIGTYAAMVSVLSVDSELLVYSETKTESASHIRCSNDLIAVSDDTLVAQARSKIQEQFRNDLIPRTEIVEVKLKTGRKGISKKDQKVFRSALKFVKQGRLDRGCPMWTTLFDKQDNNQFKNRKSIDLLFNLGVCAEAQSEHTLAGEYYLAADKILTSPDRDIDAALLRIRQATLSREITAERARLRKQKKAAKGAVRLAKSRSDRSIVRRAQMQLIEMGYDPGTADGISGRKTILAVQQFQRANSVPISGIFDQTTIWALNRISAENAPQPQSTSVEREERMSQDFEREPSPDYS